MFLRSAAVAVAALAISGCMGSEGGPVASAPPPGPVPVQRVETASMAAPAVAPMTGATTSAGVPATTARPMAGPSRIEVDGMRTAPGARESTSLSNVSRVSTGAPTGGNALGGTILSGQSAGAIPSTIDRNREPVRTRSTAPRDPLGPGTPPPIVVPELRDTTGRTIRNRQEVQF